MRQTRTTSWPKLRRLGGVADADAAAFQEAAFREIEIDEGDAVGDHRPDLGDLRFEQVALGLGHEQVRAGADAEALLLGPERLSTQGARRRGRSDLLAGPLDLGGRQPMAAACRPSAARLPRK